MILQKQHSLWKALNIFLWVVLLIIVWLYFVFQYSIWQKTNQIQEKQAQIWSLNKDLQNAENNANYKNYKMANIVKSKENNTNYFFLYQYLKTIKLDIKKALEKANISSENFTLTVDKNQVKISAVVPNYNFLYEDKVWILDKLQSKSFVEKIFVNSYKSVDNTDNLNSNNSPSWISFDLKMETK